MAWWPHLTSPASGGSSPTSICTSVVLPTPFLPMMATFSPRVTMAREGRDDLAPAVALVDGLQGERLLPGGLLHLELDEGRGDVGALEVVELELAHGPDAALHLRGARAGVEAGHEVLELGDLLLLLGVLRLDPRAHLALLPDHVVVAAGVGDDRLVVDVGDVGADGVQEVPVVRDGDEHPFVGVEEALQPADRLDVEVVGGLVEEQAPAACRRAPARGARAACSRRPGCASAARAPRRGCPGRRAARPRRPRRCSRPPRR